LPMRIFVINLPDNINRRLAIEKQLQSLKLEYEIFPAVFGKGLTQEERERDYDVKKCFHIFGREISHGELGCALSHIYCYKKIIKDGTPYALILEDDAWLNPNIPQLLEAIESKFSADKADIFLLSWAIAVKSTYQPLWAGYGIQPVTSAQCTHGYVVSLMAAKALLNVLYPVHGTADQWNWLLRHKIVNIQAVVPPVITSDLSHVSNIAPEIQKMIGSWSLKYRFSRKLSRIWWLAWDEMCFLRGRFGRK